MVHYPKIDINNVFLHECHKNVVYMKQPPSFIKSTFPNNICHLHKAIYGLKQAHQSWFDCFSLFLLHIGFFCNKTISFLFIFHSNEDIILLLVYVDDIIVTSNTSSFLAYLIIVLSSEFFMKDLGHLKYILGIKVLPFFIIFLCLNENILMKFIPRPLCLVVNLLIFLLLKSIIFIQLLDHWLMPLTFTALWAFFRTSLLLDHI